MLKKVKSKQLLSKGINFVQLLSYSHIQKYKNKHHLRIDLFIRKPNTFATRWDNFSKYLFSDINLVRNAYRNNIIGAPVFTKTLSENIKNTVIRSPAVKVHFFNLIFSSSDIRLLLKNSVFPILLNLLSRLRKRYREYSTAWVQISVNWN